MTTQLNLNGQGEAPAVHPSAGSLPLNELPEMQAPQPVIVDAEPVDPEKIRAATQRGDLKPLVADWLTDRNEFVGKVAYVSKVVSHTAVWHILHSPLHAARIAAYSPRGLVRIIKSIWAWTMYHEVKKMRHEFALANDGAMWTKLAKERTEHIHRRWIGLLVMLGFALAILTLLYFFTPHWALISVQGLPTWLSLIHI